MYEFVNCPVGLSEDSSKLTSVRDSIFKIERIFGGVGTAVHMGSGL